MQNKVEIARLETIVANVLEEAKNQGASAAEVGLSIERGLSVTCRLGAVETIEHHRDQGLGITVFFGQQKGSASLTDLTDDSIKDGVKAACSIARFSGEDRFSGLPDSDRLATQFPDLDVCHPWELSADQAITLALDCETVARELDPLITNSEGATVNSHQGISVLGNSLGFLNGYESTRHSLSCSVIGQQGDDMQRDYWYSVARNANDLESSRHVGAMAAERVVRRLGAQSLSSRQCPVLYAPEVAASLLGHFIGAISGGSLYRKSSFLLDALETRVFPEFIRIHEQPFLPKALGSSAYDGEGVAASAHDIVTDGILASYVLGSYSARKLGMESTGNAGGVHNLTIEHGDQDQQGLLATMDTGLLVTELIGQGVNQVTGDYSRGAAGFWVEGGVIQYPVEEITIAGNLKDMYQNIVAVGNDVDLRRNTRTGSILVAQMTVAGSTD
ncbi:MAG TPA: metalloprotease PmbA [Methylococcaceae bacterium]|nr:metalloprotease PmbA [Methylococcaceae bacterium]